MTEEEKKELTALKERIAALEAKDAKPASPSKRDYSMAQSATARIAVDGMSMPKAAMREMVNAIPENVMRGLREDALKRNPVTGGAAPAPQAQRRGSGWIDERPLEPPPGIAHVDRLVDAQDRIDRAELAQRLVQAGIGVEKKE